MLAEPARKRVVGPKVQEAVDGGVTSVLDALVPHSEAVPELDSLGLSDEEVQAACAGHGVDGLVERIHGRGPTDAHLHVIAWHGSALADIGCPATQPQRRELLLDCALFNLAVALTDSLVDDEAPTGARAARALAPAKLARRLRAPSDPEAAIAGETGDQLDAFFALWDALLARLGQRFAAEPERLEQIAAMLARMHHSEFDAGADRLPAKVLPIEFLGLVLAAGAGREEADALAALYRELGELVGLVDDWHDLLVDMRRMHANQLVMLIAERTPANRLRYLGRSLRRVAFPGRLADELVTGLRAHLRGAIERAGELSPEARLKAAAYAKGLLQS
ncbi:MAG TPA: hypothetical protein VL979_12675 [Solirubrobacteraceae bacterium]|nr:hypothetical protein [Solirubrobacteraceae bacterium]